MLFQLCSSCNLTGPCIQKLELRNSDDEDDGNAEFERREAWSRIVTAMQLLIGSMKGSLSPTAF